jgi:hypothetical protein
MARDSVAIVSCQDFSPSTKHFESSKLHCPIFNPINIIHKFVLGQFDAYKRNILDRFRAKRVECSRCHSEIHWKVEK